MQYDHNLEVTIATRADGGVVSSCLTPADNLDSHYHYLCAFYSEEHARDFVGRNLNVPVFFSKKNIVELAKEFNSSIVWHGLSGVAFVKEDDMVEYVDTCSFIKMAFKDIVDMKHKYGYELVKNDKLQDAAEIDFNRMYHIMTRSDTLAMIQTTYTKQGRRKEWLVVSPSKNQLNKIATDLGLPKHKRKIYSDTLFGLLSDFMEDGQLHGYFSGICYSDGTTQKYITNQKIIELMNKRDEMLNKLLKQKEIYLDEHYFLGTDSDDNIIYSEVNGSPYLLISQRMDTLLKTLIIDEVDIDDVVFVNALTLREILGDYPKEFGIALCLDDNPDHIVNIKIKDLLKIAHDGVDESIEESYDDGDINEYLLTSRCTLIDENDGYPVVLMVSDEDDEELCVMAMADDIDTLLNGLSQIEYHDESETKPTWLPTCEIFEHFEENDKLYECDGVMFFESDGCIILPKEDILEMMDDWRNT